MPARHPAQLAVADQPAIEQNQARIDRRAEEWRPELCPKSLVQDWLFKQVVINSVLVDVYQAEMFDLKPRLAERARRHWEQDRADEVQKLVPRLAKKPSLVAAQLRRTPQGCDWLIGRWEMLAETPEWGPEQRSLAFDLLGKPRELRDREPWPEGSGPAELAAAQIAALIEHRDGPAASLDQFEREDAERGLETRPVPALDRLRRRESAAFRRFQWALQQLQSGATPEIPESERPAEPEEPTEAEYVAAERAFWQNLLNSPEPTPVELGLSPAEIMDEFLSRRAATTPPAPVATPAAPPVHHLNRRARRAMESRSRKR